MVTEWLILAVITVFWAFMFLNSLFNKKLKHRLEWFFFVFFTYFIGAIEYFVIIFLAKKNNSVPKVLKSFSEIAKNWRKYTLIVGIIIIVLLGIVAVFDFSSNGISKSLEKHQPSYQAYELPTQQDLTNIREVTFSFFFYLIIFLVVLFLLLWFCNVSTWKLINEGKILDSEKPIKYLFGFMLVFFIYFVIIAIISFFVVMGISYNIINIGDSTVPQLVPKTVVWNLVFFVIWVLIAFHFAHNLANVYLYSKKFKSTWSALKYGIFNFINFLPAYAYILIGVFYYYWILILLRQLPHTAYLFALFITLAMFIAGIKYVIFEYHKKWTKYYSR